MNYYIKPTYPNNNINQPSIFFKSWINNMKIVDEYNNWKITGDFVLYNNAELPNYTFFINLQTYFATVSNIKLVYQKRLHTQHISNSNTVAYKLDKYTFSFYLNIKNSNLLQQEILDQNISFNFKPAINADILNQFGVILSNDDWNKVVTNIESDASKIILKYANTYDLKNQHQIINFDLSANTEKSFHVEIPNFFASYQPVSKIARFYNTNDHFKILSGTLDIRYKINNKIKQFKTYVKAKNYYGSEFDLTIDNKINLNLNNNEFEDNFIGVNGIFSSVPLIGEFDLKLSVEYFSSIKTIKLNRQFSFINNLNNQMINSILILNNSNSFTPQGVLENAFI